MPLVQRKKIVIVFTIFILILIVASVFFGKIDQVTERRIKGEIISLNRDKETLEIRIDSPPHIFEIETIELDPVDYWALSEDSQNSSNGDMEYIEIIFDDLLIGDPVNAYYHSKLETLSLSELANPEKFVVQKEFSASLTGGRVIRDLIGIIIEKKEDGFLLGVALPHKYTGKTVEIRVLSDTDYKLVDIENDSLEFNDQKTSQISFDDLLEGKVVQVHTADDQVGDLIEKGDEISVERIGMYPGLKLFPDDITFWGKNLYGEVVSIDKKNKTIEVSGSHPLYFTSKEVNFNLEDARIRKFLGSLDEFVNSFESADFSNLYLIDFEDIEIGDRVILYLGEGEHFNEHLNGKEIVDTVEVIIISKMN